MKTLFCSIVLVVGVLLAAPVALGQPPEGSHLSPDDNNCITCHGEPDLWEGDTLRLYISRESLANDVHWQKGVNCHDCHGGNPGSFDVPEAHATEPGDDSNVRPFRTPLTEVRKACVNCHEAQQTGLDSGVHAQKNDAADAEKSPPSDCFQCHGDKPHQILSHENAQAPTYKGNQPKLCGECHQSALADYKKSVHGQGLIKAGLMVTAVCANCHDAHKILPASNPESSLFVTKVADTCGKCHRFIEERLMKSVHGSGNGPGGHSDKAAAGGEIHRTPSCTDCHVGHDFPDPTSAEFRMGLANRCGKCHVDPSNHFFESIHGQLTELGYVPAARCSDCHGSHDIVSLSDPASPLAPGNRRAVCMKCHKSVPANLATFDPHANPEDRKRNPIVYFANLGMELLLFSVFSFFGVHTLLWFVRSIIDVRKHGRPKGLVPGEVAYRRFRDVHRSLHVIIIISFLGLAATGLPLKYSAQPWAQTLVGYMGGFGNTGLWHRIFGVATFFYFGTHLVWLSGKVRRLQVQGNSWIRILFGPDSPVPTPRDIMDMVRMIRWFLGLGPKPGFERWAYWEKFDYWAVFWGVGIIGTSGLILWFPNLFCLVLPGWALNVAKVIHSEEALLATAFVFAVHFFHSHLRAEKFPMDLSILSGLVSEEEFREERPEYFARLQEEGRLRELKAVVPPRINLSLIFVFGAIALTIGVALLLGIFAGVLSFL